MLVSDIYTSIPSTFPEDDIRESTMASITEEILQPVMELPSDTIPTSLEHGPPILIPPPAAHMIPITPIDMLSARRKRKHTSSLKRSASTPNVRGHHSGDAGMSLAEKRRNKLGYHRTSVACGHCRRRKIRCLAAPDDPHGRCANCIRLKKECNFFPVEQQPPMERRPRAGSSVDLRASTSSDSSPALNGSIFNPNEPFNFNSMNFSSNQDLTAVSTGMNTTLVSPLTRVPENPHQLDFHPSQRTSWGSPFPDGSTMSTGYPSPGDPPPQVLWGRHTDSPGTPGFSPRFSGPTSSMPGFTDSRNSLTSFAPSRSESAWSAPARSMSYGVLEGPAFNGLGSNYYPPQLTKDVRRRASDAMRPPSLQTGSNSSNTSISETHLATPLSAPVQSPPSATWNMPTTPWSAFPSATMGKPYETGWYDSAPLAKVQEEELVPHFGSEPAIIYTGVEGP